MRLVMRFSRSARTRPLRSFVFRKRAIFYFSRITSSAVTVSESWALNPAGVYWLLLGEKAYEWFMFAMR